jgi:geranylgeranyl diphosphate synthase type II
MDNADIRRGRPSVHKKYDENVAILAGDNLMAVAYLYLTKDSKNNVNEIVNHFTQGIIEICEGQSYDKDFEIKKNVNIDEYLLMIKKKTAALAEMCCYIGAKIVGGSNDEVKNMAKYGLNLGLAFQLQDDLLDIFGDEKKFGKTVGGDLIEGKKTFLFLKALEKSKGEDKILLKKVIENKGIRKSQVKKYKEIYERLGVIEDTKKEIRKYSKNALKCVSKVKNSEAREILFWLTHKLVDRIH